jgi:hypothetical protein
VRWRYNATYEGSPAAGSNIVLKSLGKIPAAVVFQGSRAGKLANKVPTKLACKPAVSKAPRAGDGAVRGSSRRAGVAPTRACATPSSAATSEASTTTNATYVHKKKKAAVVKRAPESAALAKKVTARAGAVWDDSPVCGVTVTPRTKARVQVRHRS